MLSLLLPAATLGFSASRMTLETDVSPWNPATSSWRKIGAVPPTQALTLQVPLTIDGAARDALEKTLYAVSDPDSASYGKHLGHEALKALIAVPADRAARVRSFFMEAGAFKATLSPHGDVFSIVMPAAAVEKALQTTLAVFSHEAKPSVQIVRAEKAYSVPGSIAPDVAMVGELHQFPRISARSLVHEDERKSEAILVEDDWPTSCGTSCSAKYLTPGTLQARYNIPATAGTADPKNTMSVAEFQGQYFNTKDLEAFSEGCDVSAVVSKVIGGNVERAGIEAMLDIEYMRGVTQGINLTVIYASTYSLLNWANNLMDLDDPPLINSVSYGNDERQQTGVAFMDSVNTAFMKAGAMGLSILFASGDQGVCGREGCGSGARKRFKPDFPGGSPYHTSVGGTDFYTSSIGEEQAWRSGGGGFSDTFAIPEYQADAVAKYKADLAAAGLAPAASLYNDTGRGYPDVSALGGQKAPYCINVGRWTGVAGTSASCPVVGAVFARLNALRLAKGQPPMGFLNPFIYQNPSAFQDVTKGINSDHQADGFTAIAGWDAATGFGTPDYAALAKIVEAM